MQIMKVHMWVCVCVCVCVCVAHTHTHTHTLTQMHIHKLHLHIIIESCSERICPDPWRRGEFVHCCFKILLIVLTPLVSNNLNWGQRNNNNIWKHAPNNILLIYCFSLLLIGFVMFFLHFVTCPRSIINSKKHYNTNETLRNKSLKSMCLVVVLNILLIFPWPQ